MIHDSCANIIFSLSASTATHLIHPGAGNDHGSLFCLCIHSVTEFRLRKKPERYGEMCGCEVDKKAGTKTYDEADILPCSGG